MTTRPRTFCWVWGPLGPQPQIMFDDPRGGFAGARILSGAERKLELTDERTLDQLARAYPAPVLEDL